MSTKKNNKMLFALLGVAAVGAIFLFKKKNNKQNIYIDTTPNPTPVTTKKTTTAKAKAHTPTYKFKIGEELISAPKPGFSKTPYYYDPRETSDKMEVAFWNTLPGSYMGKIVDRLQHKVTDQLGKTKVLNMYKVINVPASFLQRSIPLWVFGVDVEKFIK